MEAIGTLLGMIIALVIGIIIGKDANSRGMSGFGWGRVLSFYSHQVTQI